MGLVSVVLLIKYTTPFVSILLSASSLLFNSIFVIVFSLTFVIIVEISQIIHTYVIGYGKSGHLLILHL